MVSIQSGEVKRAVLKLCYWSIVHICASGCVKNVEKDTKLLRLSHELA